MSGVEHTLGHTNRLSPQNWQTMQGKLRLPQKLTILLLIIFNTRIIDNLPINIGPLTPVMLMELIIFILAFPWIRFYMKNIDKRDKLLLFVGLCMFGLSLINLTGHMGNTQFKYIFTSMYAYIFIVIFFSNQPKYDIWLRRLHIIPVLAALFLMIQTTFLNYGGISSLQKIGANHAAAYIAMILPICWVQIKHERFVFRLLNLLIMVSFPVMLLISASRTAFLIFLIVSILIIYIEKLTNRIRLSVILILMLFSILFMVPKQSVFLERIASLKSPVSALKVDRTPLWAAAIYSIKENIFLGGDFRANVHRLVLEAAPESNYASHIRLGATSLQAGVHNGHLAVFVYYGIIVGFLYYWFFFSVGKALIKTRKMIINEKNRKFLAAGFISLIGYAIANITLHMYIGQIFFIVWAVLQVSIKNSLLIEGKQKYMKQPGK